MRIEVWNDPDIENPCDYDGWKVYSFCRKHIDNRHPEDFITPKGNWRFEFSRKAEVGLLFPLSYFEHSGCAWSIRGEGMRCPWDSVDFAGAAIWTGKPSDIGAKTVSDRAKDLRRFLETYNAWCNGQGCGFTVYDGEGEEIDSCGGFYSSDDAIAYATESHPELAECTPEYV